MPAYRAPIPQQVYKCLLDNPDGCPYDQMARFFRQQAADNNVRRDMSTVWPSYCQTTEQWQALAPPVYQHPDQINEPLGDEKAGQLAQALGREAVRRCQSALEPWLPAAGLGLLGRRNSGT
jgi:hypothetical protein